MSVRVLRVTDRIVCVRRASYLTCSYLVRIDNGVVVVDAGMKSDGSDVLAGLAAMGATPADVRAILLTHWHNDHAAGAAEIRAPRIAVPQVAVVARRAVPRPRSDGR